LSQTVLHFSLKIITYRLNKQSCKERLLKPKTEVWTLKQNEKPDTDTAMESLGKGFILRMKYKGDL